MSAIDVSAHSSPAKLPMWRTIAISYTEWLRHFPDVVRATALWITLLAITTGVAEWLKWSMAVSAIADLKARNPKDPGFCIVVTGAFYFFFATVFVFALIDVAVSLHRRVILNDIPQLFGNVGNIYFWRYAAKLLVVLGIAAAPLMLLFVLIAMDLDFELPVEFEIVVPAMGSLILLMVLVIFTRLSFALPVEATSRPCITWIGSWRLTRGNTWRLAIGLFVCGIVPGYLINMLLEWVGLVRNKLSVTEILITAGTTDTLIIGAIRNQILTAATLAILPIGVGFLSYSYQRLVPK